MTRNTWAAILASLLVPAVAALAAAPVIVSQVHRAFSVSAISIQRGDTIRFDNADEFIHHIYIRSPAFSFNSGEQAPGHAVEVPFPVSGTFEVRCEIHPKMLLKISVQ